MRVFAALPLPPAAIASILAAVDPLRRQYPRLRWVNADAMHVTLHFFGEVADAGVERLRAIFELPSLRRSSFLARLGAFGQFPPGGRARVLWIGLDRGAEEMRAYWQAFQSAIAGDGWERDPKGFTPHITVARVGNSFLEPGWEQEVASSRLEFEVSECVLFQSVLERSGPRYLPLTRIAFGRDAA